MFPNILSKLAILSAVAIGLAAANVDVASTDFKSVSETNALPEATNNYKLKLSADHGIVGQDLIVNYLIDDIGIVGSSQQAWIGVFAGQDVSTSIYYKITSLEGSIKFDTSNFRIGSNRVTLISKANVVLVSTPYEVEPAPNPISLTLSPQTQGDVGTPIRANYTIDSVSTKAYIGLFKVNAVAADVKVVITSLSGTVDLQTKGLVAGDYTVKMINKDRVVAMVQYTLLCVGSGCEPQPQPQPPTSVWLTEHNNKRRQYRVADLKWSTQLTQSAQSVANNLANVCRLASSRGPYGENLALGSPSAKETLRNWVDAQHNNWHGQTCSGPCGNFAQVLWASTEYVGCAVAYCQDNSQRFVHVCHYLRPGNCNNYDYTVPSSNCGPFTVTN